MNIIRSIIIQCKYSPFLHSSTICSLASILPADVCAGMFIFKSLNCKMPDSNLKLGCWVRLKHLAIIPCQQVGNTEGVNVINCNKTFILSRKQSKPAALGFMFVRTAERTSQDDKR